MGDSGTSTSPSYQSFRVYKIAWCGVHAEHRPNKSLSACLIFPPKCTASTRISPAAPAGLRPIKWSGRRRRIRRSRKPSSTCQKKSRTVGLGSRPRSPTSRRKTSISSTSLSSTTSLSSIPVSLIPLRSMKTRKIQAEDRRNGIQRRRGEGEGFLGRKTSTGMSCCWGLISICDGFDRLGFDVWFSGVKL